MNYKQIKKRQRKYALTLFAQGKIDRETFGMMLHGLAEYWPCSRLVRVYWPGSWRTTEIYIN